MSLEPRSCEAHDHAAALGERHQPLDHVGRQLADIGEHQHRGVVVERARDGRRQLGVLRLRQLRVRSHGALQIVERRQQRLRLLG